MKSSPTDSGASRRTAEGRASRAARAILVLGDGRIAEAIAGDLAAAGFAATRGSLPRARDGSELEAEAVAELLRPSALAVCALEDAPLRWSAAVAEAAERAGTPTLFVTAGPETALVGPLFVPGVTASFGDAPDDARSHAASEALARAVAAYVGREIALLSSPWPESVLFGHVVEVTPEGGASRSTPVLPGPARPGDAAAGEAVRDRWPELHDAAVLRLAVTDSVCAAYSADRQVPESTIRRICIVGGGTAGYLTALTLRRRMPHLEVALLESSKVPIIGVGEATTPLLPALLHGVLGIDIEDFFRTVRPTFKLGIRFEWGGTAPGDYFNYPFGAHGQLLEAQHHDGHILHYSLQSMLMSAGKIPIFRTGDGTYESRLHLRTLGFAYHIDNQRFVSYLHREARRAGVRHIDATVREVVRDGSGELVAALVTDDGERHEYDFYVDCSGFRSLLLEQTLGSRWISYAGTLFTDRAIAANVPHGGVIKPYTVAETMDHGWCWNIATPEEDHRGYVFSSAFCDEDRAVAEMRAKNPGLGDPRVVVFRSGRHGEFWKGNVAAIGNAYAFVEPLESTGIHMIIESILAFIGSFPQSACDEANRRCLNRHIGDYWDDLRAFLGIHFRFNTRLDTPFWRACRASADISSIEDGLALYRSGAPLSYRNHHLGFDRLWGDNGRDVLLMGQRVPAVLLPPRESREEWAQRVRLGQRAVAMAVPHAEGLRLLLDDPRILQHLVSGEDSWIQRMGELFRRETSTFSDVRRRQPRRQAR
jgi:tryptophan halogenase